MELKFQIRGGKASAYYGFNNNRCYLDQDPGNPEGALQGLQDPEPGRDRCSEI